MMATDEIEQLVMACCHIHNSCIRAGDIDHFEEMEDGDDPPPPLPIPHAINKEAERQLKEIITINIR